MLTVIWVIGSMLLVFLLLLLIPFGFTFKGKLVIAFSSGLLALGGLGATLAIPVGQTFLVIFVLSLFGAYIMDNRLGKVLYMTNEQFIEVNDIDEETNPSLKLTKQNKTISNEEIMDLSELEITSSSSVINQDKNTISDEPLIEDISFLHDREVESDIEEILMDDDQQTVGYLSDIEILLEEDKEKVDALDEEGWLDELAELPVIKNEDKNTIEEIQMDDFELDELFADKEVAATRSDSDVKKIKQVGLQK